jgi:hypothetical protein
MRHPRDESNYSARLQAPICPATNNKAIEFHVGTADVLMGAAFQWHDLRKIFHENQTICSTLDIHIEIPDTIRNGTDSL